MKKQQEKTKILYLGPLFSFLSTLAIVLITVIAVLAIKKLASPQFNATDYAIVQLVSSIVGLGMIVPFMTGFLTDRATKTKLKPYQVGALSWLLMAIVLSSPSAILNIRVILSGARVSVYFILYMIVFPMVIFVWGSVLASLGCLEARHLGRKSGRNKKPEKI